MTDYTFQKDLDKIQKDYTQKIDKVLKTIEIKRSTNIQEKDQQKIQKIRKKFKEYFQKIYARR